MMIIIMKGAEEAKAMQGTGVLSCELRDDVPGDSFRVVQHLKRPRQAAGTVLQNAMRGQQALPVA